MILVFLADGFEMVEALAPIDAMRRAGIDVVTLGVGTAMPKSSHGIAMQTDASAADWDGYDDIEGIVLPGGMPGTLHLGQSTDVRDAIAYCVERQKLIAAICAAPSVLGDQGVLQGKTAVCYPGFEDRLAGAEIGRAGVVCDQNVITAKGAGVAWQFGFAIVSYLRGKEAAEAVMESIQWPK